MGLPSQIQLSQLLPQNQPTSFSWTIIAAPTNPPDLYHEPHCRDAHFFPRRRLPSRFYTVFLSNSIPNTSPPQISMVTRQQILFYRRPFAARLRLLFPSSLTQPDELPPSPIKEFAIIFLLIASCFSPVILQTPVSHLTSVFYTLSSLCQPRAGQESFFLHTFEVKLLPLKISNKPPCRQVRNPFP